MVSPPRAPLQATVCRVWSAGEDVVGRFGNVDVRLQFEDALLVSYWISIRAREAKQFAGDRSRIMRTLGTLHDASAGDGPPDIGLLDAKAAPILRRASWDISTEGQLVVIKFGSTVMRLPYRDAQVLAQWLRQYAKEAQRRAGDKRHWSRVGLEHLAKYGPGVTRG
jgi:hypothetical protein